MWYQHKETRGSSYRHEAYILPVDLQLSVAALLVNYVAATETLGRGQDKPENTRVQKVLAHDDTMIAYSSTVKKVSRSALPFMQALAVSMLLSK